MDKYCLVLCSLKKDAVLPGLIKKCYLCQRKVGVSKATMETIVGSKSSKYTIYLCPKCFPKYIKDNSVKISLVAISDLQVKEIANYVRNEL